MKLFPLATYEDLRGAEATGPGEIIEHHRDKVGLCSHSAAVDGRTGETQTEVPPPFEFTEQA